MRAAGGGDASARFFMTPGGFVERAGRKIGIGPSSHG
jgi:hypothetical protein